MNTIFTNVFEEIGYFCVFRLLLAFANIVLRLCVQYLHEPTTEDWQYDNVRTVTSVRFFQLV